MKINLSQNVSYKRHEFKNLAGDYSPDTLKSIYIKNRDKTKAGWTPLGGKSRNFYNARQGIVLSRRQYDSFIKLGAPKEKSFFEKKAARNKKERKDLIENIDVIDNYIIKNQTYEEARKRVIKIIGKELFYEHFETSKISDWTISNLRGDGRKRKAAEITIFKPYERVNVLLLEKTFTELKNKMQRWGAVSFAPIFCYAARDLYGDYTNIFYEPLRTRIIEEDLPVMPDQISLLKKFSDSPRLFEDRIPDVGELVCISIFFQFPTIGKFARKPKEDEKLKKIFGAPLAKSATRTKVR